MNAPEREEKELQKKNIMVIGIVGYLNPFPSKPNAVRQSFDGHDSSPIAESPGCPNSTLPYGHDSSPIVESPGCPNSTCFIALFVDF